CALFPLSLHDALPIFDVRLARKFTFEEKRSLEFIAEAFNLGNTLNVRFFNTVYGASDFCPFNPTAFGCPATPSGFLEGSPNPLRSEEHTSELQSRVDL